MGRRFSISHSRSWKLGTVFVWALLLSGCPAPVPLPTIAAASETSKTAIAPPDLPLARGNAAVKRIPLDASNMAVYRSGDRDSWGVVVTPELAAVYDAYHRRDADTALSTLHALLGKSPQPMMRWAATALSFDVLLMLGRPADAEAVADDLAALERTLLGYDLLARSMRGLARLELGDYDQALADFGRVARAIGTWSLPTSYSGPPTNLFAMQSMSEAQLRAYAGIASVYLLRKDFSAALRWAEATEGLFNDLCFVLTHPLYGTGSIPAGAGEGRAYNLAVLGGSRAIARREPQAGEAELGAAQRFFSSINHNHGLAVVHGIRAMAAMELGRPEEANRVSQEGERLAAAAGLGDMVWNLGAERGKALLAMGRKDEAEAALRSAQNGVELASGALSSESSKIRFGTGKEEIARHLIRFDLDKADHAALFRDMERARARAFIDMLGDRPVARGRHADLAAGVRDLDRQILRQRLLNGAPGGVPGGATKEAEMIEKRLQRVGELRRLDPELADTLSIAVAELRNVQAKLEVGETMAYAIPGEAKEKLRFLLVTRERSSIMETELTYAALSDLVANLAQALEAMDSERQKSVAEAMGRGLKIAAWGAPKAAYMVPSGAVYFVPWGALDVKYSIAVLPTGGWLLRTPVSIGVTRDAAIVGDPDFHGAFKQLSGARREAVELGRLYRAEPLIGAAATEKNLRSRVGSGVDVLHLATHGFFDAAKPLASSIALSGKEKPLLLTAAALFELPLPGKLVVLSACETGVGKAVAGDDFLGLARSFYLGGTLAVLSSLWPVDDASTKIFMEIFHELARKGDYGSAWLAARDRLRAAGLPPFSYGAFVLGGALRG